MFDIGAKPPVIAPYRAKRPATWRLRIRIQSSIAHTNRRPSAWAPLRRPLFRAVWIATVANAALAVDREGSPKYQKLRYEEDYRYLQDPSKRIDWFDLIKYVPLSEDGEDYLFLGGLIRERYEYIHNPLWGQDPQDKRGVFLQRYMLHADVLWAKR